jgi:hypothetical protein
VATPAPTPAPAAPTLAEGLLLSRPDGTAFVVITAGQRRLVLLSSTDPTPANEGPSAETAYHRVRLEEGTPVTAPRTLQMLTGNRACTVRSTHTHRAEVMAIEGDATVPAPLTLWVAEATVDPTCPLGSEGVGGFAIAGEVPTRAETLEVSPVRGTASLQAQRQIRRATPRPPERPYVATATIDAVPLVYVSTQPDDDGCTTGAVTYLVRAGGAADAYPGEPLSQVIRTGAPEAAYVVIVESTTDPGRPASHLRVVPVAGGAPLLDAPVVVPWSTAPNC